MNKHKSIKKWYQYFGDDCYSYHSECSCGYEAGGWLPTECEEERLKHEITENYNLPIKDVEDELEGIIDAINAKIIGVTGE